MGYIREALDSILEDENKKEVDAGLYDDWTQEDDEEEQDDVELEETSPYTDIKSNGIYSLNTGWVKHPVQQDIPDIDMDEFEKEFKVWEDKYFDLLDEIEDDSKENLTEI
jgi:hypothetical protein